MRWCLAVCAVLLGVEVFGGPKVRQGDIEVEVLETVTDAVRLTGGGLSDQPAFQVRLRIHNTGNSAVAYKGWAMEKGESNRETSAKLRFGLSGVASPVVFDGGRPFGQSSGQQIPPGGTANDLLTFEPPPQLGTVSLTLPGRAIGNTSDFRLTFPVKVSATPPATTKPIEPKPQSEPTPPVQPSTDPKTPELSEEELQKRVEEIEDVGEAVAWGMGFILFIGLLGFLAYFAPLGIAIIRGHHQTASIAVINIFLGWSFIGWIIALAMAFSATDQGGGGRRSRYDDDY